MNILGINQVPNMISWQHDSAAALVKDGKIVATAEENDLTVFDMREVIQS